ncbi:SRPBCC family protein [Sphingobacterium sp. Mn56C]|uniref:SRPBCC family protein n=1 Tax=Sphingobacterium sp. Mn56C TaxID=3395261 RepID=UPI003BD02253
MPQLILETKIKAPLLRVFDLARSIDLHMESTEGTHEVAIAGVTSGLIKAGEIVKWRAKHLGVYQTLTVEITKMERPYFFEDKMLQGAFKSMQHQHIFEEREGVGDVIMRDIFTFYAPFGFLGRVVEWLFLTRYMRIFLEKRNQVIKRVAESDAWKNFVN